MKDQHDPSVKATPRMRGYRMPGQKLKPRDPFAVALKQMEGVHSMKELRCKLVIREASGGR